MTIKEQARELARLAKQKAHLEAVRRLQLAFELELRDCGCRGEELNSALATINSAIGFMEDKVGGEYDNVLFNMEEA